MKKKNKYNYDDYNIECEYKCPKSILNRENKYK